MATAVATPELTFAANQTLTFQVPAFNKVASFDSISETSAGTFSTKEFRYSTDGLNFSSWGDITNLISTTVVAKQAYLFEIRYKASTAATLTDFTITYTPHATKYYLSDLYEVPSVFDKIEEDDPNYIFWYTNLKDKFNKEGIIPEFVKRTDSYLEFWEANCRYFAMLYAFINLNFVGLYENREMLREYLLQRGVYLDGRETLSELQDLANNFLYNYARRGTNDVLNTIERIAEKQGADELLVAFVQRWYVGWLSAFTSPTSTYVGGIYELNKLPTEERKEDVFDLTNYDLLNDTAISIVSTTDNNLGRDVDSMELDLSTISASTFCGITVSAIGSQDWLDHKIEVDQRIAYEVYFRAKIYGTGTNIPELNFYVQGVDSGNNFVNFEEVNTGTNSNNFLVPGGTNTDVANLFTTANVGNDDFIEVRGIIFEEGKTLLTDAEDYEVLTGVGKHLRFPSGTQITHLYPGIRFKQGDLSNDDWQVYIHSVRVQPLLASQATGGFLTNIPQVLSYIVNNSVIYTDEELKYEMDKYILPANTVNLYEFIS